MGKTTTETEEKNPLAALDTVPEILGFFFHREGAEGLRQFFDYVRSEQKTFLTRESLEAAADELELVGMRQASEILREEVKSAPEEPKTAWQIKLEKQEALCPYPPDTIERRAWYHREGERERLGHCPWCRSIKAPEDPCASNQCIEQFRHFVLTARRAGTFPEAFRRWQQEMLAE